MDEKKRVVVTGLGVIAANGLNKDEFLDSLINCRTGLKESKLLSELGTRTHIAGSLSKEIPDLIQHEEKTVLLGYAAIDEAFRDSGLSREDISARQTRAGLSFSTSMGGYLHTLHYVKQEKQGKSPDPESLLRIPSCVALLADYAGIDCGPVYTTMSACAAGTSAIGIALDQIRSGRTELMVVVGADPLTEISASGFNILQSMSIRGCSPFDKNRDGMTIGEGASAVIIETLESALRGKRHIYAELLGYGIGNDAYHITSPDPKGISACNTMNMAFEEAGIDIGDIDYINAHGTGTLLNDEMEIRAIANFFGEHEKKRQVAISSTKSLTGHCLGAAGSVEFAAILLAVDQGIIPATYGLEEIAEEFTGFHIIKGESIRKELKAAMSNSFAFAGHSASILIRKYSE